jgi:hypothetical protein
MAVGVSARRSFYLNDHFNARPAIDWGGGSTLVALKGSTS